MSAKGGRQGSNITKILLQMSFGMETHLSLSLSLSLSHQE
jgi:hypothetical protein